MIPQIDQTLTRNTAVWYDSYIPYMLRVNISRRPWYESKNPWLKHTHRQPPWWENVCMILLVYLKPVGSATTKYIKLLKPEFCDNTRPLKLLYNLAKTMILLYRQSLIMHIFSPEEYRLPGCIL